jgi:hypothetical protein
MDVDGDFNGGFDGGFNLAVLGYQPQQSVQQLRQEAKQTCCFTDSFYALLNKLVILRALKRLFHDSF